MPQALICFLYFQFEKSIDFHTNPLYALLHESIYCEVDISNRPVRMISDRFSVIYLLEKTCFANYFYFFILLITPLVLKGASSGWSAHKIRAEYENQFNAILAAKEGRPVYFTGEVSAILQSIKKKKDHVRKKPSH